MTVADNKVAISFSLLTSAETNQALFTYLFAHLGWYWLAKIGVRRTVSLTVARNEDRSSFQSMIIDIILVHSRE
jgi:hypothetical protein